MDYDSYSERLSDLNEFSKGFLKKPVKVEKKKVQIINKSIKKKSVIKVQFGQLNDKRFYFSNGLISYHLVSLIWKGWEKKNINIERYIKS